MPATQHLSLCPLWPRMQLLCVSVRLYFEAKSVHSVICCCAFVYFLLACLSSPFPPPPVCQSGLRVLCRARVRRGAALLAYSNQMAPRNTEKEPSEYGQALSGAARALLLTWAVSPLNVEG